MRLNSICFVIACSNLTNGESDGHGVGDSHGLAQLCPGDQGRYALERLKGSFVEFGVGFLEDFFICDVLFCDCLLEFNER